MGEGKRSPALNYRRKNRRKVSRAIIQLGILILLGCLLVKAIFTVQYYEEPVQAEWDNHEGFVAVSYFGVNRSGSPKLVAKNQLNQQLDALYDQGFVTISQQDLLDFYQQGKALPDKALYLSFEDGRNDSSLFAQPLLERYNFKATMYTYGNKFGNSENKFLQAADLKKMERSGYWELGSNGFRLAYINIFDKDGLYIGKKEENELENKANIESYNHYLMDFIRDENMIPLEDRDEMEARITADYDLMKQSYEEHMEFMPKSYMMMHANSLYQGMNPLVADVNDENIKKLYGMHFNREGVSYNKQDADLYNLTRLQPQPYWYTNHLLMRIQKDSGMSMKFVVGDEKRAQQWKLVSGAAQFINSKIALTSPAAEPGRLVLKDSDSYQDIQLTATLDGNVVGKQSVYARYDESNQSYVKVTLDTNNLIVTEKKSGQEAVTKALIPLDQVSWSSKDVAFDKATVYSLEQSLAGRSEAEELAIPINIKQTRELTISIQGNKLNVDVDQEPWIKDLTIDSSIAQGAVALESEYTEQDGNDDIYDGVFEDIVIRELHAEDEEMPELFNNKLTGLEAVVYRVKHSFDTVIDWAIDTF